MTKAIVPEQPELGASEDMNTKLGRSGNALRWRSRGNELTCMRWVIGRIAYIGMTKCGERIGMAGAGDVLNL